MIKAVESQNIDLVKHVLSKNINVAIINNFNCNILHVAAQTGNLEVFRLLADKLKGLFHFK